MTACWLRAELPFAAAAIVAFGTLTPTTSAQWTVTILHPPSVTNSSQAMATNGVQQFGFAQVNGLTPSASLWSGTAASWVTLNPPGVTEAAIFGASGTQQVGYARVGGWNRAALWTGTAESWINLAPAGSTESQANDISGAQQGGFAVVGGVLGACLWSGSAASWVNLHPAAAWRSTIVAMADGEQVGNALIGIYDHACMWKGTAESWIDLHPAGASHSFATAVGGGHQAGMTVMNGLWRSGVWSGTAESWVDLTPAGATESVILGGRGKYQVGYVVVPGTSRASLWSGTADSWVDLGAVIPPGFLFANAADVFSDDTATYVVGYGHNSATGGVEALLWTRPRCSAPDVTLQPVAQHPCPGGSATFSVVANGTAPPFTYQWRKDGIAIDSSSTGNPSAATAVLMLTNVQPADLGLYDCTVSSAGGCGAATSHAVELALCYADINCSGVVSVQDVFDFLGLYFANDLRADFNASGAVSVEDIFAFLASYFAGC